MSSEQNSSATLKAALLKDIHKVHAAHGISRRIYREHGNYSERQWRRIYNNFRSFLYDAGLTDRSASVAPPLTPAPTEPVSLQVKPELAEISEIAGNQWTITLPKTRICTLEELLEHCKVDTSIWDVERITVNKWEMGYKNQAGVADTIPLFQVKAVLKKHTQAVAARKEVASLKEEAKKFARTPSPVVRRVDRTGNMLEINIPDAHFGKLAWGRETSDRSYDTAIAEQTFLRAVETLIERSKHFKFDKVLFVVGNDLLNSDNMEGTTTKGTYVNTDGRYQKTFAVVRRTIISTIERLRGIAPVQVVLVSGNHDDLSVWHLGDSLECYFHNYDDVEIENEPTARKYVRHGNVLLMLTHGDKGKRLDYPLLMATDRSRDFGETLFREAHTGHTHTTKLDEQHGVRVRVLPALCPPDSWHAENGYTGNQRNAEGYIWNDREGLIAQVFHNDDAYPEIKTKREIIVS